MAFQLLGESKDTDTQFIAFIKGNQDIVLIVTLVAVIGTCALVYSSFFQSSGPQGTWRYGICHAFLEQYETYPTEIKILTAAEKEASAQIGYISTNSFGSRQSELMECFYQMTAQGPIISGVTIDNRSLRFEHNQTDKPNTDIPVTLKDNENRLNEAALDGLYKTPTVIQNINIDNFNQSIPVILSTKGLDLSLPQSFPRNIEDLKYE